MRTKDTTIPQRRVERVEYVGAKNPFYLVQLECGHFLRRLCSRTRAVPSVNRRWRCRECGSTYGVYVEGATK